MANDLARISLFHGTDGAITFVILSGRVPCWNYHQNRSTRGDAMRETGVSSDFVTMQPRDGKTACSCVVVAMCASQHSLLPAGSAQEQLNTGRSGC